MRSQVERKLEGPGDCSDAKLPELTEELFRWMHNEDAMATEKLAEGPGATARDSRSSRGVSVQQPRLSASRGLTTAPRSVPSL